MIKPNHSLMTCFSPGAKEEMETITTLVLSIMIANSDDDLVVVVFPNNFEVTYLNQSHPH